MRVLAIPDLHAPYTHPGALGFISDVARTYKPDVIVSLGDEADFSSVSRWGTDPNMPSPGDEVERIRSSLHPWFKRFPRVFACTSNHNDRPLKKAQRGGLSRAFLKTVPAVLNAPSGWEWRDSWTFDGVLYSHGEGVTAGYDSIVRYQRSHPGLSVVIGHVHTRAAVLTVSPKIGKRRYAVYAGCLIDPFAPAFEYAKNAFDRPCIGCVTVTDGIPQIVPLIPRAA